ncbi:MAG: hypothetical protein LBD04_05775 [Synergistaceae bacterium]|jgi:hypothetical protein|nr:hypothetical protein [Synergistaceae bacterium]
MNRRQARFFVFFWISLAWTLLTAFPARGEESGQARRLFELHEKIRPGMSLDAITKLLGPPADSDAVGGNAVPSGAATRYIWLHGEIGIEVYEWENAAYQVSLTLPCGSAVGADRLMGELTGIGRQKYGSTPLYERARSYYYWERDGVRFSFSKYNKTTVKSFCGMARR